MKDTTKAAWHRVQQLIALHDQDAATLCGVIEDMGPDATWRLMDMLMNHPNIVAEIMHTADMDDLQVTNEGELGRFIRRLAVYTLITFVLALYDKETANAG